MQKIVGKEYPRPQLERGDVFSHGPDGQEYVVTSNQGEKSPGNGNLVCREMTDNRNYKYTLEDSSVYYKRCVDLDDQDNIVEKKGKKMKKAKITPVQKATRDLLIAEVKKRTEEARKWQKGTADTRDQKIADLIATSDFGCRREQVVQLVSLIIGKDLPPGKAKDEKMGPLFSKVGIAIVPISAGTNGHDYAVGKACLTHAVGSAVCLKSNGNRNNGNNITIKPDEIRAATDKEIDEFFSKYPMENLFMVFDHDHA